MGTTGAGTANSGVLLSGGAGAPSWGNSTSGNLTTQWDVTTSNNSPGVAIKGTASATTSGTIGVQGVATASPDGTGVSAEGGLEGVYARATAINAGPRYGVYATANQTTVESAGTYGAYATVLGPGLNVGVYGESENTTGGDTAIAVQGVGYTDDDNPDTADSAYGLKVAVTSRDIPDTAYGVYASVTGPGRNVAGYFAGGPVTIEDSLTMGTTGAATQFSVKRVNLTASGVLFTQPSASVELEWNSTSYTLSIDNKTGEAWDIGIHRVGGDATVAGDAERSASGADGADLSVSTGASANGSWNAQAAKGGSSGPGFTFHATSYGAQIQGLVVYWW
jgi:hypothetical protein